MSRPPSPSLSPELEPLVQASTRDDDNESVGGVDGTLTPPSGNSSPFDDDFARENPAPAKTAKTDVWGFYSYSFAVEVFAVVSLTLFLPLTLEQYARENGRLLPDLVKRCRPLAPDETRLRRRADRVQACAVRIAGRWIDTASFSLYAYSVSVACQALVVITMGNAADRARTRKQLLIWFAGIGSVATMLFFFLPSSSPIWAASALLTIIANVGFGSSIVCLNSFLPTLARGLPEVMEAHWAMVSAPRPLREEGHRLLSAKVAAATATISATGIALGYLSGILALALSLVPVSLAGEDTWGLRIAIGGSGVWWAVFSIPAIIWLPQRPSPLESPTTKSFSAVESWRNLWQMLKQFRRLKNTYLYLLAWFLLSDAFTTITSTAVLFAKTTLNMPASALIIIGMLVPMSGVAGALAWPRIQRHVPALNPAKVGPKGNLRLLMLLIIIAWLVPVWGSLGFILGFGGLSTWAEMYIFAVYFGAVYGAFQSYARTVYSGLIPPGQEARWFALYSITDKSSSFLGPLIVGLIADRWHSIRAGFPFIAVAMLLPIPVLMLVDVERGKSEAEEFAKSQVSRDGFE